MKTIMMFVALVAVAVAATVADGSYSVKFAGGSLSGVRTGAEMRLLLTSDRLILSTQYQTVLEIPVSSIKEITHRQEVRNGHSYWGSGFGWAGIIAAGTATAMNASDRGSRKDFIGLT